MAEKGYQTPKAKLAFSAVGHWSALPPKADIRESNEDVCFVPEADICDFFPKKVMAGVRSEEACLSQWEFHVCQGRVKQCQQHLSRMRFFGKDRNRRNWMA